MAERGEKQRAQVETYTLLEGNECILLKGNLDRKLNHVVYQG